MADLTSNSTPEFHGGPIRVVSFDVGANVEVFEGQLMETGANGIVNATGAGGDVAGFSMDYVDNRTGAIPHGGAARAVKADVAVEGYVWLSVTKGSAFAHSDVGAPVYNDADGTTFNTTSTSNSKFGVIVNCDDAVVDGGSGALRVLVYFNTALAHLLA